LLERTGIPLGLVEAQSRGWNLGLASEDPRLLISVGAAALGAPFWYRLLDRIGSLRNTGRPPAAPSEELVLEPGRLSGYSTSTRLACLFISGGKACRVAVIR
jgi:hypothetical protein